MLDEIHARYLLGRCDSMSLLIEAIRLREEYRDPAKPSDPGLQTVAKALLDEVETIKAVIATGFPTLAEAPAQLTPVWFRRRQCR